MREELYLVSWLLLTDRQLRSGEQPPSHSLLGGDNWLVCRFFDPGTVNAMGGVTGLAAFVSYPSV
jgi:hypothetical protein